MDEEHRGEEPEVEAHTSSVAHLEPADEGDDDHDVEAHVRKAAMRLDSPSHL